MAQGIKGFLFQNKNTSQTMAKNTFWLSFGQLTSRLIKAVLMIYAARILGTAGYGVFAYALSLVALLSVITDIGIGPFVTRALSKGEKENAFLATAFMVKLGLLITGGIGLIFLAPLFTRFPDALPLIPLIALLVFFDEIRDFVMSINRAEQKMQVEAGVHVFTNTAIVILGLSALLILGTTKDLMGAYVLGSIMGTLLSIALFRKYFKNLLGHFDRKLVGIIIKDSWPYALLGLLGIIMINTDVLMLSFLKNESEVGLYAAANRPVQILYVIPAILAAALFPVTSRLANKDNKKLRTVLEQTLTASFLIGLPIMVGGVITGNELISLIFGSEYSSAGLAFQILLLTILIVFPSMILADTVFAYNKQRSFIGFLFLGVVGNILLNLILIPTYGITGSAVATIGAELLANSLIWYKMKRINYFTVLPHMKRIIPAAIGMGILTLSLQSMGMHVVPNIAISAGVYFFILRITKESLLKDLRTIIRGA